jgi:hypothetical protein
MDPKTLSLLIVVGGWALGARIGWTLMDRWLVRRQLARESTMKNITPRKEK